MPARRFQLRIELDRPRSGAENMARDCALLDAAAKGAAPALRLYRWERVTLSLGHRQRLEEAARADVLAALGIPWVRRPTGGRALLHRPSDLTYAFAAGPGAASGVLAAYQRVMGAIRAALASFVALDAPRAADADRAPGQLPCLAVATGHEIAAGGRKLVAGAQRWRRGAFLQHGSIPWRVDRGLTSRVAGLPEDTPLPAVGLAEIGPAPDPDAVADALADAFAREFVRGPVVRRGVVP